MTLSCVVCGTSLSRRFIPGRVLRNVNYIILCCVWNELVTQVRSRGSVEKCNMSCELQFIYYNQYCSHCHNQFQVCMYVYELLCYTTVDWTCVLYYDYDDVYCFIHVCTA
jgi:hypothetical protein